MPVYTRTQTEQLFSKVKSAPDNGCYLIIGDRFLCRQLADELCTALGSENATTHNIDGEREDFTATLQKLRTFSLFAGKQIYRVNDTSLFHSKNTLESQWKKIVQNQNKGNHGTTANQLRTMLAAAGLRKEVAPHAFTALSEPQWKKLFGFNKPTENIDWTHDILVSNPAPENSKSKTPSGKDTASLLEESLSKGLPTGNILVLIAEDVDKRKRLYKYLKDNHVVIDLGVDTGSGSAAKKQQRTILLELIEQTLKKYGKSMGPGVADTLLERVGFQPVAAVMETEKLVLYLNNRDRVEKADIDLLVGRTRQEALFELTGALGARNLEQTLLIALRLLENGYHSLAIIATLRNNIRSLLLFRTLLQFPEVGYHPTMSAQNFQNKCLPTLKENAIWTKELSGHPYAIFMQFKTASGLSLNTLKYWLVVLLKTEMRLKGSFIDDKIILHNLFVDLLSHAKLKS
ncbi:MAG: hypothetical protein OEM02_09005 [Desulfobulbaceae bacterium]|nr:hypothetical protein [Desulfobulbaceae bacterium]